MFKRPRRQSPSPTPSLRSESNSSNSRFRSQSSESNQAKKYYILHAGLKDAQKYKVDSVCQRLGAVNVVTEWCESVTHLVIGLAEEIPKKDMVCVRNLKYLQALMGIEVIEYCIKGIFSL
jgi:hypothetical protein